MEFRNYSLGIKDIHSYWLSMFPGLFRKQSQKYIYFKIRNYKLTLNFSTLWSFNIMWFYISISFLFKWIISALLLIIFLFCRGKKCRILYIFYHYHYFWASKIYACGQTLNFFHLHFWYWCWYVSWQWDLAY